MSGLVAYFKGRSNMERIFNELTGQFEMNIR